MTEGLPTIAIIGAGASGALCALHLLTSAGDGHARLVLVGPDPLVGAGVAYSTTYACHLLNVPASGMSALDDDPAHFVRWLDRHGRPGAQDEFVPRRLYGQYLRDSLQLATDRGLGEDMVDVVHDQVVGTEAEGGRQRLVLARATPLVADAVVLATGIVPRHLPPGLGDGGPRCIAEPWDHAALSRIEPSATVTLIGSGLTAVDTVLSLYEGGHRGPVHAISHHGLLPRAHLRRAPGAAVPGPPVAELAARVSHMEGTTTGQLFHQFRQVLDSAAAAGADWRDVVDVLRPVTASLWQRLDDTEKRRFRRHLERLWNVHRHRMAPEVAQRIAELRDGGLFHVHAGTVRSLHQGQAALRLDVALGPARQARSWATDWVVNCTGPDPEVFSNAAPLMTALRQRGVVVPGPLGMGVATDDGGRPLDAQGRPVPWMWALGSLRQGELLESTAVPEIRKQAQEVAVAARGYLRRARTAAPAGRP
jgi:uncharacterized NAD(P)/FAD-binding protein YdhS